MSGMLSAHYADIEIQNCQFQFAHGDDALSVKYGDGILENSYFFQNEHNTVDFDYNIGKINDNYFFENGNDTIETDTSEVLATRNHQTAPE